MSHQKAAVQQAPRKIGRVTSTVVSAFFGIGVAVVGVALGYAIHPSVSWITSHAALVVKTGLYSLAVPAIWLFGRPLAILLERR